MGKLRNKAINLKRVEMMQRNFATLFLDMLGEYLLKAKWLYFTIYLLPIFNKLLNRPWMSQLVLLL